MSYHFFTNPTSNQNEFHQPSDYQKLEMEVLRRAPQLCAHDFSNLDLTSRWKHFWNEKICLLWLHAEGLEWIDIILWFAGKGIQKSYDAFQLEWTRVSEEVSSLC